MSYCVITRNDVKSKALMKELKTKINKEYDEINPKCVIAIGGDGTLLKAFHQYPDSVIFGIHTGHLGFYSNYSISDIDEIAEEINNDSYNIDEINLIDVEVIDEENNKIYDKALNEVTIVAPTRTMRLDVYISGEYFEHFRGTGFCISTPTGSTAYNKSLNGSVVDTSLNCLQLTEIAGINSNAYRTLSSPLVLSYDRKIKLIAKDNHDAFITVDHKSYSIDKFKEMNVYYNGSKLKMAYKHHEEFLKRIKRTFLKPNEE